MSTTMQRVRSAPAFGAPPPPYGKPRPVIKRTKTSVDFLAEGSARPTRRSASSDGEDAFSLGGFFPPPSARDSEFGWVREEDEGGNDDVDASLEAGDDDDDGVAYAHPDAVIRSEDRMGVLAIFDGYRKPGPLMAPQVYDGEADERIYSPYTADYHYDEESLHRAFLQQRATAAARSRQTASSTPEPNAVESGTSHALGELFQPEGAVTKLAPGGGGGWGLSALRTVAGVF